MRNVLRDENTGEITHVHYDVCNGQNRFVSKRDHTTLITHTITEEELKDWLGEDFIDDMTQRILELLNAEYSIAQFRYDVISYNDELLKDEVKLIEL